MNMEPEGRELIHHGVKGQKWGVRRTPEQLGHRPKGNSDGKVGSSEKKKRFSLRKEKKKPLDISKMSDKELQDLVNRMQLEKRFSDLSKGDVGTGKKIAVESLKSFGKASMTKFGARAGESVANALFSKLDDKMRAKSETRRSDSERLLNLRKAAQSRADQKAEQRRVQREAQKEQERAKQANQRKIEQELKRRKAAISKMKKNK